MSEDVNKVWDKYLVFRGYYHRGEPSPPTEHSAHRSTQTGTLGWPMEDACILGSHVRTFPSMPKMAQVPQGAVADIPSKTGQQLQNGYSCLRFQAGFPTPLLSLNHTRSPHQTPEKPRLRGASTPAELPQLPQGHHPRTSLPVLAIKPTSAPDQGVAHRFQSWELDRPQISKKPSAAKPSLLQIHFTTEHGICHRPWLHK